MTSISKMLNIGRCLARVYFYNHNIPDTNFDGHHVILVSAEPFKDVDGALELHDLDYQITLDEKRVVSNIICRYSLPECSQHADKKIGIDWPFGLSLLPILKRDGLIDDEDFERRQFARELRLLIKPWPNLSTCYVVEKDAENTQSLSTLIAQALDEAIANNGSEVQNDNTHSVSNKVPSDWGKEMAAIYLYDYLLNVLPGIEKRASLHKEFPNLFSKLFIACPRDEKSVDVFNSKMKPFGIIGSESKDRDGRINTGQTDVFEIEQHANQVEEHLIMLCVPYPVKILQTMFNKGKLSFREYVFEVDIFYSTLKKLLSMHRSLADTYIFLEPSDKNCDINSVYTLIIHHIRAAGDSDIAVDGEESEGEDAQLELDVMTNRDTPAYLQKIDDTVEDRFIFCNHKLMIDPMPEDNEASNTTMDKAGKFDLKLMLEAIKSNKLIRNTVYPHLQSLPQDTLAQLMMRMILFMRRQSLNLFNGFIKTVFTFQLDNEEEGFVTEEDFHETSETVEKKDVAGVDELDSAADTELISNGSNQRKNSTVDFASAEFAERVKVMPTQFKSRKKKKRKINNTGGKKSDIKSDHDTENSSNDCTSSELNSLQMDGCISHRNIDVPNIEIPVLKPVQSDPKITVIKNVLYGMIEDKLHLPYDFEVLLRNLVLELKVDASTLRNAVGQTLLHCAAVHNRHQFVLPLFRIGCWKDIWQLTVETGMRHPYEGQTAEEICTIFRHRKVQKEIDTFNAWEKSMNLIHMAARRADFSEVKRLLDFSQDLHHELDSMDCSTLYWAVIGGNIDIVNLLIDLKVDHTRVNLRKETLLHACCMLGHKHLIETLVVKLNMDLSVKDVAKKSALLRVAENGDTQTLARLVDCGMKKELLGLLLAIAGHYGRIGFIKFVVSNYEVDPQSKDEAGKSAYLRAGEQGRMDVLKYMFTKRLNFAEIDVRKRNILHSIADGAESDVMEYVIAELKKKEVNLNAIINAKDRYIGGELCMLIRGKDKGRDSWHYVEVVRGLFDMFMKRTRGGTIDVAKYGTLLNSGWGADPDDGAQKEIEKRFEARRSSTVNEDLDVTALQIAVFKDKLAVARILLENGSDVSIRDKFGLTPLHVAAMRGNIDMIKLLLKFGAKTDRLDALVKTPADVAEDNEHRDAANYLKSLSFIPISENFCSEVIPNVRQLLSTEHIQTLHEAGTDVRAHMVNTLRDLTVSINEALLALGSGPVHEESSNRS